MPLPASGEGVRVTGPLHRVRYPALAFKGGGSHLVIRLSEWQRTVQHLVQPPPKPPLPRGEICQLASQARVSSELQRWSLLGATSKFGRNIFPFAFPTTTRASSGRDNCFGSPPLASLPSPAVIAASLAAWSTHTRCAGRGFEPLCFSVVPHT